MCAIAGILNLTTDAPIDLPTLGRMIEIQRHRGPDATGIYVDDRIGLGHARLSVIDLAGGTQPIHNEDKTLWIVLNGEIFNYPELREGLKKKGHLFYTKTDTEVLLHLYEEEGVSCLEKLNGQFAFAVWDSAKRRLFMARDRVGIVPLHYHVGNGRLLFASEIKGIFADGSIPRAVDPQALDQIFTFWTTLPGKTFFKDVREIPGGHYLIAEVGRITLRRYWDYDFNPEPVSSEERVVEEVLDLLEEAARIRLRADVPVGSYLSGGLDSSGLTALVRKHFVNHLRTFGIGFEEKDFDESGCQKTLADFLRVDHTALNATNSQISESFEKALWHCEKPLMRTAPVPMFLLSRLVRENGFKVVLTGEGADEVFGGYNIFREAKVRSFCAREPGSKTRPLLLGKLYPYIFKDDRLRNSTISFFGQGFQEVEDPFYSHRIRWKNTARTKGFFSEELRAELAGYDCLEDLRSGLPDRFGEWDVLARAQYLEARIFMETYLLSSQGDRMAMGHSVEIRPPYLDHRVIDMASRLPAGWKIRGLKEKYILKKSFERLLPEGVWRRSKQPYRAPIKNSFLDSESSWVDLQLDPAVVIRTGFFESRKVSFLAQKMKRPIITSETDEMALTGILSTQMTDSMFRKMGASFPSGSWKPGFLEDMRGKAGF